MTAGVAGIAGVAGATGGGNHVQMRDGAHKYGVAIHNFKPLPLNGPVEGIALRVGELFEIYSESTDWYYGSRITCKGTNPKGIFPKSFVKLRECSVDRTGSVEIVSIVQPQIVQEITQTLREWGQHWKHLYVTCGEKFKFIEVSMRALLELRSSILSGTLPLDELKKVQRTAIYTIDKGNRELGMDLVVRGDSNGTQIDPTTVSACQLYNYHSETSDRIKLKMDSPTSVQMQATTSYNFYASVRNFVCKMSEDAELLMSLYDGTLNKHFTESYVVRWSRGGLASDIDQLHNLKVLFTDLGTSDIKREKVFLVCYVVRIGGMEAQSNENRRSSVSMSFAGGRTPSQSGFNFNPPTIGTMRRPLGVAAMDITHIFNGDIDVDDDKQYCITFFPASEKDNLDSLLKRIISNKDLKGETKTGQGLWISVKLLYGDSNQPNEKPHHLSIGNISIARKIGFPEVILPGDTRNDLYLCLLGGSFSRGSSKSTDRNIQVTVRVCDAHGERIPEVISLGGGKYITEYNSVIYYHEDKPRWNETFKICIPFEEFERAHVVFLFKHRSSNETRDRAEKPFALAYTQLMQKNGTTLNDIKHSLSVYKIDVKKMPSNDLEMAACYLSLPSQNTISSEKERGKLQKGFLSLSPKDTFEIETNLCSTKLTQNVDLLGVLNWRDHIEDDSLRRSLILLQTVPGGEIVKFLQDILDALFNILTFAETERRVDSLVHDKNSYDSLVFECLLYLISLVSDRKFHHFQPILDLYIKANFCETLAYQKLCHVLTNLVENVDKDDNDVLLKTMKCLEYLMRFIVRSRQLHAEFTQGTDHQQFQRMFQELLNSIVVMMKCDLKSALTSQGACIKYLPMCVSHMLQVFPDTQLTKMIGEILDVLPLERLTKQRLIAVSDLVQGPLFLDSRCRCLLLPHITKTLKILISTNDETSCGVEIRTKNRSVDKIARVLGASKHKLQEHRGYSEQLELCVKILGEILTLLFRKDIGNTDEEFNHLAQTLLRTIIAAVSQIDRQNPSLCQLVSVLLEMLRQMTFERYNFYISKFTPTELMCFLTEVQIVLRDLVDRPVFIGHWADMIHLQNNILLETLKLSSNTLVEKFYSPFEMQVWSNWFHLAISFLTQPGLQLQKLTTGQRRRIVSHYGDMRTDASYEIKRMWYNLAKYKIHFIPSFIGPFLEMSLTPEFKLREATIPLFFDMMQCEYYSSKLTPELYNEERRDPIKGNFIDFENEIIQKLDILIEAGHGDSEWREMFVNIVTDEAAKDETIKDSANNLVTVISKLLQTLLQYRELLDHSSIDYRMHATTTLLAFYSDINRREMYIRYVNKLCELHLECENWTEAALTLTLHAKLLHWSNDKLSDMLKSSRHPHCQTHRDLKEAIYYEIIHYLDKGKMWELALNICKELARQYDEEVFDYCHLSDLHLKMSTLYMNIVKEPRPQPEYFRVGYYGKGFPEFFQNKVFVYRGKEYERLQEFSSRITNGLPNAELMTTLTAPKEDITDSTGQYVQVNAVEPLMSDRNSKMAGKSVSDKILKYHQHNNVRRFRYSRPFHRQDEAMTSEEGTQNEFANLWLERTELEIKEELPGILRWNVVIKSSTHEMSPLQVAVETMMDANKVLRSLVIEHHSDSTLPLDPLTRKLIGMVDAAVMGGILNYEKAFFTDEYVNAHPEHRFLINTLKDHIASQIPLLEFGIEVHRERLPHSLAPLHQRIAECFEKMKAHVHLNYGKKNCDLDRDISMVTMRRNTNLSNGGSNFLDSSDNRWSEISTQTNNSAESGMFLSRPQTSSLRVLTSHINKQISRGSLSSGLSSGYSSLISPSSGIRTPVGSLLITPAKKREKERRRTRKSEVPCINSAPITPSGNSQWYISSNLPLLTNQNGIRSNSIPSAEGSSPSAVVELRQELTASRPLRSEVERERRLSQRPISLQSETNSNRNSAGTTDSNMSAEEESAPPPLPQKTIRLDHHNISASSQPEAESYYQAINFMVNTSFDGKSPRSASTSPSMARQDYDLVYAPRGSFVYSSLQSGNPLRKNLIGRKERAPTPPPKKRVNSSQR